MYNGVPWKLYLAMYWDLSELSWLQRQMVESALLRGDEARAREYIADYKGKFTAISKFVPGKHYHVLGEKFDSYDEAAKHAKLQGFVTEGLKEVFVYPEE